jgi:uncharacterized protein YlaI
MLNCEQIQQLVNYTRISKQVHKNKLSYLLCQRKEERAEEKIAYTAKK